MLRSIHRLALLLFSRYFGFERRLRDLLVFLMQLVEELRLIYVPSTCRLRRLVAIFFTMHCLLRPRAYQHIRLEQEVQAVRLSLALQRRYVIDVIVVFKREDEASFIIAMVQSILPLQWFPLLTLKQCSMLLIDVEAGCLSRVAVGPVLVRLCMPVLHILLIASHEPYEVHELKLHVTVVDLGSIVIQWLIHICCCKLTLLTTNLTLINKLAVLLKIDEQLT